VAALAAGYMVYGAWTICFNVSSGVAAKLFGMSEMRIYQWDSSEKKFTPARDYSPPGERVLMMSLTVEKGERVTGRPAPSEQMICLLRGAWRMKIADKDLIVRRNEAVVIPSGFEHSAVAIEDSFALQVVRE
jgi:quercetin dioxygenase-like cupin family protein